MERVSKARASRVLVVLSLVVAMVAIARPAPAGAQPAGVIPGQYIVTLQAGVDPFAKADEHARTHGVGVLHVYQYALLGYAAVIPDARLSQIQADPDVVAVIADRAVYAVQDSQAPGGGRPSDPDPSETLPTGVDRIDAEGQGPGAPVAVIDTGIDLDHPDLNVAGGVNCTSGRSYDDGNGHGTHVAGTIGAYANGIGVIGVAPGTPVYAVRVLNNAGSGSWSSVICGIDWVTGSGITIANMSLGGGGSDDGNCGYTNNDALHQAICNSVDGGTTYAVAAGNDATNAAGFVPAAYDEVTTVSALADFNGQRNGGAGATCRADGDDTFADFSNYGADVDVAAPGVCILSTWPGGYNTISGTSMASPHVAGALALGGYGLEADPIDGDGVCGLLGDPDGINEGILNVGGTAVIGCS